MTITINLKPELAARLQEFAADIGHDPERLVNDLVEADLPFMLSRPSKPPEWLANMKPREPGGLADLFGKWPSDADEETDEELLEALKDMDDPRRTRK